VRRAHCLRGQWSGTLAECALGGKTGIPWLMQVLACNDIQLHVAAALVPLKMTSNNHAGIGMAEGHWKVA